MSVKVDLNQLADALTDYTFAYLVTVDDGYKAHTVAVDPVLADGVIDVGPVGGSTRRNVTAHSDVTLVWPPAQRGGYTLIVDGKGQPAEADSRVADRARPRGSASEGSPWGRDEARLQGRLRAARKGLRHEKTRLSALLGWGAGLFFVD